MDKILILGGGAIGQAIAELLKKHEPIVFDKDDSKSTLDRPLLEAVAEVDYVFICLPTRAVRAVVGEMAPALRPETVLVSLSKGLDDDGSFVPEIISETVSSATYAAVGGPMLAADLKQGRYAAAVMASAEPSARQNLRALFSDSPLLIRESGDAVGVAVCGVLKNIYTLGLSMADALELGDDARGLLTAAATAEMAELCLSFGGEAETAYGLAGLGDLVATSGSQTSKNAAAGRELVQTGEAATKSEGLLALPLLWPRVESRRGRLPLLSATADIVVAHNDPKDVFKNFFSLF